MVMDQEKPANSVPNTSFLQKHDFHTYAAVYAYGLGFTTIVTGVSQADYSVILTAETPSSNRSTPASTWPWITIRNPYTTYVERQRGGLGISLRTWRIRHRQKQDAHLLQ
jgi:hypothetical protein